MTLPEPGDLNWGAPLNDAILAAQADAAQAKSDASSARSTAIEARQTAAEVRDFVEAPASEQLDTLLPDKIADAENPVGAAVDTVAQARADAAEQAAKDASIPTTEKAAPEGVAPLDADSRVPQVNLPEHLTPTALSASTARITAWAKNPDTIITGAITRNGAGVVTSAAVVWPDGATGTFTTDTIGTLNTIDAYHVTYDDGTDTLTFTQPTITRDTSGAATNVPAMVVS